MKEAGSPKLLFENLDLTPIHPTLWKGLHREGPGRPVEYDPEWDLKALMLRQLLQKMRQKTSFHEIGGRGVIQSVSEYQAIRRKEPGYRPSPIRFIPKKASIQTKNDPQQTKHGTVNPNCPRPSPFTRGHEKPEKPI